MRQPALAGDRVIFVCEDDLWSAPLAGGTAMRLTTSQGACSLPRVSPDAQTIAFVATDEGHPELYTMPARGGRAQRLTYLGGTATMTSAWSPDGSEIYFVGNPSAWYMRETRGFAIAANGGEPRELQLGHMKSLSPGPHGRFAIGRNETDAARWKRYRGGTSGEVWADVREPGEFDKLPLPDGNPTWPMWIGERIYFLSDHEGIGNLYSCDLAGGDVQRHTHHNDYYARFPSTDGMRIVYSAGAVLYCYDIASGETRELAIDVPSAAPQTARRFAAGSEEFTEFAPSPDGTRIALIARGRPFTMPLWEDAPLNHGDKPGVRYRNIAWMHDGKRIALTTDENGYEQIAIAGAEAGGTMRIVTSGDIGRVTELVCSPSNDRIAFANHRYELVLVDNDGSLRVLDKSLGNRVTDLAFSPDGRWLAYVWWPGGDNRAIIRIVKCKSGDAFDVTPTLRVDQAPAWDPEGKYLYFISTRDFDPVYDALQFNLSFPQAQRPFLVTLRKDVPNPFSPKPKPVHREHEHEREDAQEERKRADKPPRIDIDKDGITGRILSFPVDEGDYGDVAAVRGRVYFTRFEVRGIKPGDRGWDDDAPGGTLVAYDFEQQRSATVAQDVSDIALASDNHTLAYTSHDRLRIIDALADLPDDGDDAKPPSEPGRKSGWIDLDRINVEIDPPAEWRQMYMEAWRMQTEQFWVEDMSDIDWDRVKDRYAELLPLVRTRSELSDVIWEMHGELGTSHAYEIGGDLRRPPDYNSGFLGADLKRAGNGWQVERLYRGDSWNREVDSPLAEPGLNVEPGDVIVAIGGRRLSDDLTPQQALVNMAGRDVAVTLLRGGQERTIAVRALASEQPLRYRAWVDANRAYVHEKTNGTIGYVHVPDMGPWGFSEFHRGYLSEFDRDGLLVDVRYNRGGHVSPLLLEKLVRKRVGYDVSRHSNKPMPYPPESVAGPIVALTNQFAGSDGDIFSHCFKLYKIGPLVGKRTWGGVIGINPYHALVDGTVTTQPEFSFWFKDVGWNVENYGTDPDYDIDIAPHDYRAGKDPQLDFAINLVSQAATKHVEPYPDLSARPSLPLPSLP
ncbi:MAG TPA: PDZ domain-containing protein [Candidatus Baltobacteraceae bacterium]|nr:PDZ domain-containing protein [Candidatus Baltobacteraceae bacterium]